LAFVRVWSAGLGPDEGLAFRGRRPEDLRQHQITSISLYPGLVLTESVLANIEYFEHETNRETPLFIGRVVAALAADGSVLELTGRWLVAAEIAESYGVTDEHGVRPWSNRAQILGGSTS
jgi:hypothetical protein